MALNDVSCQLHLPVEGRLLDHDASFSRSDVVDMMVELLGAEVDEDEFQVHVTKVAHGRFSWLRKEFKLHLDATTTAETNGDDEAMQLNQDHVICIYLL